LDEDIVRTILKGLENSDSLVQTMTGNMRVETTITKETMAWMASQQPSTPGRPAASETGGGPPAGGTCRAEDWDWATDGEKCYLREIVSGSAGDGVARTLTRAYDGEKQVSFDGQEGYIHDRLEAGACRPEVALGLRWASGARLSRWLREHGPTLLKHEDLDSQGCYVLEVHYDEGNKARLWIAPGLGFRAVRMVRYGADGGIEGVTSYEDFKEYAKGVWLPCTISGTSYAARGIGGFVWSETKWRVREAKVNEKVPPDTFELTFPNGTPVYDARSDRVTIVGADAIADADVENVTRVALELTDGRTTWAGAASRIVGPRIERTDGTKGKGFQKDDDSAALCLLAVCAALGVRATSAELVASVSDTAGGADVLDWVVAAAHANGLDGVKIRVAASQLARDGRFMVGVLRTGACGLVLGRAENREIILCPPTLLLSVPDSVFEQMWRGESFVAIGRQ
jgi:hypothetical protein